MEKKENGYKEGNKVTGSIGKVHRLLSRDDSTND